MRSFILRFFKALGLIAAFSLAGFALTKLAFEVICWIIGHDMLEATIGLVASVGFGGWIGVEAFLTLRDWRSRAKPKDFDTSR